MSLVIRFSETDLGKITMADAPDPLWEVLLCLHALQAAEVEPVVDTWRTRVDITATIRGLFGIAPSRGYSPDFLTPEQAADGVDAGLEAVLGTPAPRLRAELHRLTGGRDVPYWARALATADPTVLHELAAGLRVCYRSAVAPYWESIVESVRDDRHARARALLDSGLTGLLSTVHPLLTWHGTTLELHGTHVHGELILDGRGLRLQPSFFCQAVPTVLADPTLPPVLVYPITADPRRFRLGTRRPDDPAAALAPLLGKTRAALLAATAGGCTTTELSRQAGISAASASYHASILREAGLVETHRDGRAVRHTLTELGASLMAGQGVVSSGVG